MHVATEGTGYEYKDLDFSLLEFEKRPALSLDSFNVEEELLVASPPTNEAKLALGLSEVQVQIFDLFGSEPIPLVDERAGEPG